MPNFIPRQDRSTWKPITCVLLMGFYSRAIQPCAFQEVSTKHTRGLSQSLALGRGADSMKGVNVTHGSGSKFLYQCLLMCISNYTARLVSQYFWHQPRQSLFNCSPCLSRSSLEEGRGQGGFLRAEMGLGRP